MIKAETLKALDSMLEAIMALKYLNADMTRSAAEKAYMSWSNALVAFLLSNRRSVMDTIPDSELYATLVYVDNEKDIGRLAEVAEDLGLAEAGYLTKIACQLREYHKEGLRGVKHPYYTEDQVKADITILINEVNRILSRLKQTETWDKSLESWYSVLKKEFEKTFVDS